MLSVFIRTQLRRPTVVRSTYDWLQCSWNLHQWVSIIRQNVSVWQFGRGHMAFLLVSPTLTSPVTPKPLSRSARNCAQPTTSTRNDLEMCQMCISMCTSVNLSVTTLHALCNKLIMQKTHQFKLWWWKLYHTLKTARPIRIYPARRTAWYKRWVLPLMSTRIVERILSPLHIGVQSICALVTYRFYTRSRPYKISYKTEKC